MKHFRPKTIVLVLCLLLGSVFASAEETLTNRSVERMVAAGLSPDIIASKIKTTPNTFDVSIDTILALKKNGIHDDIIKAMVESAGQQKMAPGQTIPANRGYAPAPQKAKSPVSKLLEDIEEAKSLKEKRDYTWKTKAHAIGITLKTIYPSNTHNIKYWWAYTQYSVLVEKEHHILKGLKKVLYFDANHIDALILQADTFFAQAKRLRPGDDSATYSREEMGSDAKKAYRSALKQPKIASVQKAQIYFQLGEITQEIDKNRKRAKEYWRKAMDEDPQSEWAMRAADRIGVMRPQSRQDQEQEEQTARP